jgi:hypothetical protein
MYFTGISLLSGCWHGVQESSSEQDVSGAGVFQFGTSQAGWKAYICDMCGPILKDILYLAEHEGTQPGQKPYMCGACGRGFWISMSLCQFQKEHSAEKPFICWVGKTSRKVMTSSTRPPPVRGNYAGPPSKGQSSYSTPVSGSNKFMMYRSPSNAAAVG